MPPRRPVELRVGGQTYRVVATDDDQHVQRLAELVDRKYVEIVPSRGVTPQQAIFLTAMALAEEVEEQRARAARLEVERDRSTRLAERAKDAVVRLLQKVDSALSGAQTATAAPREAAKAGTSSDPRSPTPLAAARTPAPTTLPAVNDTAPDSDRAAQPPDTSGDALLFELLQQSSRDVPQPLPRDVPQSLPREAPPLLPREQAPRSGGLRLLRQPASTAWGAPPGKPVPDDEPR